MQADGFRAYSRRVRPLVEESFTKELFSIFDAPGAGVCSSLFPLLQAGKKVRGCLACMVAELFGGDLRAAVPRAVAIELIQAATLIHDDFVDQDTIRRNRPALWTLEGSRRAVLIGDAIFASAISMMNDLSREDGVIISNAVADISRGALNEPLGPSGLLAALGSDRWTEVYEEIIRLKTGILFASACQLGALAAGCGSETQGRLYRFGLRLGEAYQIADDLKEIREHVLAGLGGGIRIAALAPAVMRFSSGRSEPVLTALMSEGRDSTIQELLCLSEKSMEEEIERRLTQAIDEICLGTADGVLVEWMRSASRDIIEMFNES